jgi:hypothetical protein
MAKLLKRRVTLAEVEPRLVDQFSSVFGRSRSA